MPQQLRQWNLRRKIAPNQLDQAWLHALESFWVGRLRSAMQRVADLRNGPCQNRSAQRFPQGADIAVGDELREMQRRFVERARHVEALEYRLELPVRCDFSRRRNDEAEDVAPPQRHANHVADLQRQFAGVI